jgi:hypothetical protein
MASGTAERLSLAGKFMGSNLFSRQFLLSATMLLVYLAIIKLLLHFFH